MGCCGQKRAALSSAAGAIRPGTEWAYRAAEPQPAGAGARTDVPLPQSLAVKLRYRERSRILVHGSVTGRRYEFSGDRPVQPVDARDVQALLHTRYFERVDF